MSMNNSVVSGKWCLQCFNTTGLASRRASGLLKKPHSNSP